MYGDGRKMRFLRILENLRAGNIRKASNEYFFGNLPDAWADAGRILIKVLIFCFVAILALIAYFLEKRT